MRNAVQYGQTEPSASDNFAFQILCKFASILFALLTLLYIVSRYFYEFVNLFPLRFPFSISWVSIRALLPRTRTWLLAVVSRTLAPLRRIIHRSLEVYAYQRRSEKPVSFVVHDVLECGHTYTNLDWDIFDLLNGYTQTASVQAKRHRCQLCAAMVVKKPVQSVALAARAGVA